MVNYKRLEVYQSSNKLLGNENQNLILGALIVPLFCRLVRGWQMRWLMCARQSINLLLVKQRMCLYSLQVLLTVSIWQFLVTWGILQYEEYDMISVVQKLLTLLQSVISSMLQYYLSKIQAGYHGLTVSYLLSTSQLKITK